MNLIQGTEVLLLGGDLPETVSNVLIGEPSPDGRSFTLGIPKGDSHIWTDRKLSFFGRTFRTVGLPAEGIEANIPLCWHKKVRAEQAEITGSCTVYTCETFQRHVYSDVFFYDGRGAKTTQKGTQPEGDVSVNIWSCSQGDGYEPKAGDIILPGECDVIIDTSSQEAVSDGLAQLRAIAPNGLPVIKTVNRSLCGLKYDYAITAR